MINLPAGALSAMAAGVEKNPLTLILPLIAALAISMIVISVMVHLAPRLGMIDRPDSRKVHTMPIPRVGGVGIVIGALLPIVLFLPFNQEIAAFILGALVLFGFGIRDDCKELGHYVKFTGQFIAVLTVVYYGDVFVVYFPFLGGEPVPESIGRPFTVVAMVGMINAINHSDGLDGLAGGESLLSLGCIAWLSYLADGTAVALIALVTIGGLFGFMRFNTYPARIFMGDGGSQFLGYTLGYLVVLLTQQVNPVLSPALPLLILGLPIADIIMVLAQRIYHKMNWFRATRNHIHHRLLDLGFYHYESVMIVYSLQALLVLGAVIMPYESDVLIAVAYLAVVTSVFGFLYLAERNGWRVHAGSSRASLEETVASARYGQWASSISYLLIIYGISVFLLTGVLVATKVPFDFTVAGIVLFVLLLFRLLLGYRMWHLPLRLLLYTTILFIVYLGNTYQPAYLTGADPFTYIFFGLLTASITVLIRSSDNRGFNITPMDFLVVLVILGLVLLARDGLVNSGMMAIILKSVILFYGCELILARMKHRWNVFTVTVLVCSLLIGVRGLILNVL